MSNKKSKMEDGIFWALKFEIQKLIKNNKIPEYETFEEWALSKFNQREQSTVKAKCRSVYQWYKERDFHLPERKKYNSPEEWQEKSREARCENLKRFNEERAVQTRKKIEKAIDIIKSRGERISVRNVAKHANVSTFTSRKYLQEIRKSHKND